MTEAFECRMCGQCCQGQGGIVLSGKDLHRLALGLNMASQDVLAAYTVFEHQKPVLTSQADGTCIFFHPSQGCTVHAHKPDVCRAWPFFRGNLEDAFSWRMAQESCPGINPDVSHSEFVRQGLVYLQEQGLIHPPGPYSPSALVTGHLWETYRGGPKN